MRANWYLEGLTESQINNLIESRVGTFDISSSLPAITAILADTDTTLLNNALGSDTNILFKPTGVSQIWDATTNRFDFSELTLGTRVDIRFDFVVTTTSGNQTFNLLLELGSGLTQFTLPVVTGELVKGVGSHRKIVNTFFYIGSSDVIASPCRISYMSDGLSSVLLNGFAVDVRLR